MFSLLAAMVMVSSGAGGRPQGDGPGVGAVDAFAAFCWGWLVAGLANVAIGAMQVFAADWVDGNWIAHSGFPGRAVGNLRQPNHLSSLLLWSCIATAVLLQLGRLGRRWACAVFAALVFTVVLTASRTGLVSVVLLAVWGALDRRLSRPVRGLLIAAPLIYAAAWLGMAQWAALSAHSFGGTERLAETDISSSRFAIWRDTLALIRQQPWTGVGFGEFNYAWTLTPSPHRPTALFDHTHNLPLQLAVELGLPLALLITVLFIIALVLAASRAWAAQGELGTAQRSALVMVLMIGLHSLLEYPLWYIYFLLPAAWAWGYALWPGDVKAGAAKPAGEDRPVAVATAAPPSMVLGFANLAVVLVAAASVMDYARVAAIFSADEGVAPLAQRIAVGQRSVFFAHHADYAAVTSGVPVADPAHAFDRATHYLLDTRLMQAWAESLAAQGRVDQARYVAERLREFRKEDAAEFFAPCPVAAPDTGASGVPFQCSLPVRTTAWRDLGAP